MMLELEGNSRFLKCNIYYFFLKKIGLGRDTKLFWVLVAIYFSNYIVYLGTFMAGPHNFQALF